MLATLAVPMMVALSLGCGGDRELIAPGGDDARGELVNLSLCAGPCDPVDGCKPTVVITHGFNPCPRCFHFTFPQTYASIIRCRWGSNVNVLFWNWNADTFVSLRPQVNAQHAADQGRCLAAALLARGVKPQCTQLIGHSVGCIVMASAAQSLLHCTGEPVAKLTQLDPLESQHELVFEQLAAYRTAMQVENIWAPGISGYGAEAPYPGVLNIRVPGATPIRGAINPALSNHLHVVRWHLDWMRAAEFAFAGCCAENNAAAGT